MLPGPRGLSLGLPAQRGSSGRGGWPFASHRRGALHLPESSFGPFLTRCACRWTQVAWKRFRTFAVPSGEASYARGFVKLRGQVGAPAPCTALEATEPSLGTDRMNLPRPGNGATEDLTLNGART